MVLGVGMLAWLPHWAERLVRLLQVQPWRWYLLIGVLAAWVGWRCVRAILVPTGVRVRAVVGRSILSLVMLDAVACYAARGLPWAVLILLFLLPAIFLGRWIETT